jgi:hypothetical protein
LRIYSFIHTLEGIQAYRQEREGREAVQGRLQAAEKKGALREAYQAAPTCLLAVALEMEQAERRKSAVQPHTHLQYSHQSREPKMSYRGRP